MTCLRIIAIIFAVFNHANSQMDPGERIVAAARSQIGLPYSWDGGGYRGKSLGIGTGSQTVGFDCSGLAQYAVYMGTGIIIQRESFDQFRDPQCQHVPYEDHKPGDLVFFNNSDHGIKIHHVAVLSGNDTLIQAPQTGEFVSEAQVNVTGRVSLVQRCF